QRLLLCVFHTLFSLFFFFSSRRRHTRFSRDWSSDVCSSDLADSRYSKDRVSWPVSVRELKVPNRGDMFEPKRQVTSTSESSRIWGVATLSLKFSMTLAPIV